MTGCELDGGRPVVLVVEDEPLVRLMAVDMVEDAGFTVVEATDADEAIAILSARDDVRIVFTDVDMPGSLDGLRLAAHIRERWPPLHIVVTSGKLRPAAGDLPARALFVPKPYTGRQVREAICRLAA